MCFIIRSSYLIFGVKDACVQVMLNIMAGGYAQNISILIKLVIVISMMLKKMEISCAARYM
jgi:hypothetical protein